MLFFYKHVIILVMNILVIGNCTDGLIDLIKSSKTFEKLYITKNTEHSNIPDFEYSSIEDLVKKIKRLQIDLAIVTDKNFIKNGNVDILKMNFINVISPNKKWYNLEKSRLVAKQLLSCYSINFPQNILAPKEFPLIIKTDSKLKNKIVNSMDELIAIVNELQGETTFLEEFLDGKTYSLLSLWDGKNAQYFYDSQILTEVQEDRLEFLKTKLNFMLSDERADFMGFFTIQLLWAKNEWFVLDFDMTFNEETILSNIKKDFLYLLEQTLYQNLNEY